MPTTAGLTTAVLAAISHGTNCPAGQAAVQGLFQQTVTRAAGAETLTDLRLGHVDVEEPDTAATLSALSGSGPAVIVPLLLSAGFHVNVDLQDAADASERIVVVSGALGPDERLTDALEQRLNESGADPASDVIILGAAGSSDGGAVRDVKTAAGMLADRLRCPVQDAYLSFAKPTVVEAVSAARDAHPGSRIVLTSYLLAPGYFQRLLSRQQADVITAPVLNVTDGAADIPPGLPEIILDRFQQGLARL
ncbi:sirohydrochlorin chelatase [Nesterenkonia natronophila]|uniref:Cobalamin biosynthesis protein CbiX n=1 Tax=Nesterenkonia natronophila TaxID=2174932 RepID=A0A3A4F8X6_9MICC|nr:CbiX/SirB N-terminal domain-containing protein [Nesterenkonia natronophila]RJN31657.1 cobalamin biosynthesis protein CbiX [Nesterenkonia natronophila]